MHRSKTNLVGWRILVLVLILVFPSLVAAQDNDTQVDSSVDIDLEQEQITIEEERETITRDEDGEVERIERERDAITIDRDGGIAAESSREVIERRWEPVSIARFTTGAIGYQGVFSDSYNVNILSGSLGFRSVRAGQTRYFPDESGGSGGGMDFQTSAQLGIVFGDQSGFNFSALVGLGYSWYTFERFDPESLTQPGRGFTLGLGVLALYVEEFGIFPVPYPYFSFDRYAFNPSTAEYSSSAWRFFIWPSPLNISINYAFSF